MAANNDEHMNLQQQQQQQQDQPNQENHDDNMSTDERDRIAVVQWLRDNYIIDTSGSVSKCEVYAHYLDMCKQKGVTFPMSRTYYGKLVRRAFPGIRSNRKGPRGLAKQHYTHLVRRMEREDGVVLAPPAGGSRRARSASLPSSPALSPSSMNASGCLSFTFQVRPQKPRHRSVSCKSSSSSFSSASASPSSSVQSSPAMHSPLLPGAFASPFSSTSSSTASSPATSTCSSPRSVHHSPLPSSPMASPMPSPGFRVPTPQPQYLNSQPTSPWSSYYDDNGREGFMASSSSTSLSPYLNTTPMTMAPSVLSAEAEVLLRRCAMLRRVRERVLETSENGTHHERPTRDSFLFRAINDPAWNDAWTDMGFSEWCLDNLL